MKRKKSFFLTFILLALFIVPSVPASATTYTGEDPSGPTVLLFSKDPFTDSDQEDVSIRNALISVSNTVTVFDGGDGSSSAWSTALTGKTVLVFPEVDGTTYWQSGDTAVLTSAAKTYIKDWVSAGKTIIGTGSYSHLQAITDLTGVDFTSVSTQNLPGSSGNTWEKQVSNANLPATVPSANLTKGIEPYSTLSTAQKAVMEAVYYDSAEDNAAVINFTVGSGYYVYNAYDWYPDSSDISTGRRAEWNATLQFAATGQITGQAAGSAAAPPSIPPAPKLPRFDAFASGPVVANPGQDLVLTGARLNCTTQVQVNDRSTTFSHSFLPSGQESLSIGIPSTLGPGRHKLAMDSCDGNVVFENLLFVPKPPAVFEAVARNSIERMLIVVQVQSFAIMNRLDYNHVECIVNASAKSLQTASRQLLGNVCKMATTFVVASKGSTSELRNTHKPENIWVRVTLSNK